MKHTLLPSLVLMALVCACSGKKEQTTDETNTPECDSLQVVAVQAEVEAEPIDTVAEDWDEDSKPMFICYLDKADAQGCDIGEELRYCYLGEEDEAYYTSRAKNYKTLVNTAGKTLSISYVGVHDGPEMGNMLWGRNAGYMKGLDYRTKGKPFSGVAFTDSYMKDHTVVAMKERSGKAPQAVIDTLQARYGLKVKWSRNQCESTDGHLGVYTVQMRPNGKKCLGLRVVRIDSNVYTLEEWANNYDGMISWHVDDEGEYSQAFVTCVTHGPKGYNIFYTEGAVESSTDAVLLVRNGTVKYHRFGQYYIYVDYTAPDADDEEAATEEEN